jgi:hypothetical protein
MKHSNTEPSPKRGWRIKTWADQVEVSRSTVYNLMDAHRIDSVKLGKARIITTSPAEFLASLRGSGPVGASL